MKNFKDKIRTIKEEFLFILFLLKFTAEFSLLLENQIWKPIFQYFQFQMQFLRLTPIVQSRVCYKKHQ